MKSIWLIEALAALSALMASGQTSTRPSFEVATVKPALPDAPPLPGMPPTMVASLTGPGEEMVRFQGGPGTASPNRITYLGVTMRMLLKRAYNLGPSQILGPNWLDTQRYDVTALLPEGTDAEALRLMLQDLLAERFQMTLHREMKTLPVYLLTVAKNGPKFQAAKPAPEYKDAAERLAAARATTMARATSSSGNNSGGRSFQMGSATTSRLAEMLTNYLDLPVQDRTDLHGLYSFDLSWMPDDALLSNAALSGPSIFVAIQEQLGLRLEKGSAPVDVLVIDKAEKSPASN